jgi:hypothetical protein
MFNVPYIKAVILFPCVAFRVVHLMLLAYVKVIMTNKVVGFMFITNEPLEAGM